MRLIVMANMAHRAFEIDGVMTSGALGRGPDAVGVAMANRTMLFFSLKSKVKGPTAIGGTGFIEMASTTIRFGMGAR